MTNLTDVYWEANGLSLHTLAWSVETKAGRMASASKRGDDLQLPFHTGLQRVEKERESRVLNLPMWVTALTENGLVDTSMSAKARVEANWNRLMEYLDVSGDFVLTKRFYDDGQLRVVSGRAELLDPPDINVVAKNTWRFTLELHMADPWFYEPLVQEAGDTAFTVQGNTTTPRVALSMMAGRMTFPGGNWIEYTGTGTVDVDCFTGAAISGGVYVNGQINRSPQFLKWPSLTPGPALVEGAGTISYQPAYR